MENVKQKSFSKALAFLVAFAVFVTYTLPMSAFADEKASGVKPGVDKATVKIEKKGDTKYYKLDGKDGTSTDNALEISKVADNVEADEFDITLTVKAKNTVTQDIEKHDAAVVLVVDTSGSMKDNGGLEAAKKAILGEKGQDGFLAKYIDEKNGKGARKLAVVQFANGASVVQGWTDAKENAEAIKAEVNAMNAYGGTNLEGGLAVAYNLLNDTNIKKIDNKHVILLSDGKPTVGANFPTYYEKIGKPYKNWWGINYIDYKLHYGFYKVSAVNTMSLRNYKDLPEDQKSPEEYGKALALLSFTGNKGNYGAGTTDETDIDDLASIVSKIKKLAGNGSIDAVVYSATNDVKDILNSAGINHTDSADSTDTLKGFYEKIADKITETETGTSGMVVTDPMGEHIEYLGLAEECKNSEVTKDGKAPNTLTWKISEKDKVAGESTDNLTTYRVKYRARLRTEDAGFEEGRLYDTNGETILKYTASKKTTGRDDENAEKTVEFDVPKVSGTKARYPYTIEYYKIDESKLKDGEYENLSKLSREYLISISDKESKISKDKVKLGEYVEDTDYENKYADENYKLVGGVGDEGITISSDTSKNVIRHFYVKEKAKVTVEHWYKTTRFDENGSAAGSDKNYVKGENVKTDEALIGSEFEPKEALEYKDVNYTVDKKEPASGKITVKPGNENLVKIYYSGTEDKRKKTDLKINAIFATGKWEINPETLRYEEKFEFKTENSKILDEKKDLRAHTVYVSDISGKITPGYEYKGMQGAAIERTEFDQGTNKVNMKLADTNNEVTLCFVKHVQNPYKEVPVKVVHNYYLTKHSVNSEGNPKTKVILNGDNRPEGNVDKGEGYRVGETYIVTEKLTFGGKTYSLKKGEDAKLGAKKLTEEGLSVTLDYELEEAPQPTKVTVNHYYHSKKKVYNEETGKVDVVEYDDDFKTETFDKGTFDGKEYPLYAGIKYPAKPIAATGYTCITDENDRVKTLSEVASENVIDLHYMKDETIDERDNADRTVMYVYKKEFKRIESGKIVTVSSTDIALDYIKKFAGKVGDTFTPEEKTKRNGEEYEPVGNNHNKEFKFEHSGTGEVIVLEYERKNKDDELQATVLTVVHKYFVKVKEVKDGIVRFISKPEGETNKFTLKDIEGKKIEAEGTHNGFVGEKYTVDLAPKHVVDGKEHTYKPLDKNPSTDITLAENANKYVYEYEREGEDTLKYATIKVTHHYREISIDEKGKKTESEWRVVPKEDVVRACGEYYEVAAEPNGYEFYHVSSNKNVIERKYDSEKHDISLEVGSEADKDGKIVATINYYYTKTEDKSKPAKGVVKHFFRTVDYDGTATKYVLFKKGNTINSYEGETLTGEVLSEAERGDYEFVKIASKNSKLVKKGKTATIVLEKDFYNNIIEFYYDKKIDSRTPLDEVAAIIVNHKYYKHDTSGTVKDEVTGLGTLEYEPVPDRFDTKEQGAYVGNKFKATLNENPTNGEKYRYHSSNPDGYTVIVATTGNEITINYVRDYDGSKVPGDKPGEDKPNKPGDDKPSNPGRKPEPKPGTNIPDTPVPLGPNPDTPVDINDNPVPLAPTPNTDINDNTLPLAQKPNEEVTIEENKTPLAGLPKTGGAGAIRVVSLGIMLMIAGSVLRKRKEQE